MNTLKNKVQLIGNLGTNPVIKAFEGGKKLAKFSLATSESYSTKAGEKVRETQWYNLVLFGRIAGIAEKYLKKGSRIAVEGKLVNRDYTDKNGVKCFVTEVKVSDLMMLGSKS